jgi:hypothetical protein
MNGRFFLRIVLAIVLIAVLVGIGTYVYNAGIAQGMAASGKLVAPDGNAMPYPYYAPHYGLFGFGLFGLIVPLLFLFLIFGALRGLFFGGPRHWRHDMPPGDWQKHVPPMFEEWHRKIHETPPSDSK